MTPHFRRVFRLAVFVAFSGFASIHAAEQDEHPTSVALARFEVHGQATPNEAESISRELSALLDADPNVVVESAAGASARYVVDGSVHSGPEHNFLAVKLRNTDTDEIVLSENYEYTNVPLQHVATDVIRALQIAIRRPTPLVLLATHQNYAWNRTEIGIALTADRKLWSVDVAGVGCEWQIRGYVLRRETDEIVSRTGKLLGKIEVAQYSRIKQLAESAANGPFARLRHCGNDGGVTRVLTFVPADHFYEARLVYLGGDLCIRNESSEIDALWRALRDELSRYEISMPW